MNIANEFLFKNLICFPGCGSRGLLDIAGCEASTTRSAPQSPAGAAGEICCSQAERATNGRYTQAFSSTS